VQTSNLWASRHNFEPFTFNATIEIKADLNHILNQWTVYTMRAIMTVLNRSFCKHTCYAGSPPWSTPIGGGVDHHDPAPFTFL
jgi:hypothetical protein